MIRNQRKEAFVTDFLLKMSLIRILFLAHKSKRHDFSWREVLSSLVDVSVLLNIFIPVGIVQK